MKAMIHLDFAGTRRRRGWVGPALLCSGVMAAALMLLLYHNIAQRRAGLEYQVAAALRAKTPAPAAPSDAAADVRMAQSAARAAADLSTPWTMLLAELEKASKDSQGEVALLGVEPDHGKHSVRVSAEARTLPLALAYIERLQTSHSLEYPMLERHELRVDDPQRPVRFELLGTWMDAP